MNRYLIIIAAAVLSLALTACGENSETKTSNAVVQSETESDSDSQSIAYSTEQPAVGTEYAQEANINTGDAFIVISKKLLHLSVYGASNGDTLLLARYPVCLSKNKGQKEKSGDMRTPESVPGAPFHIKQIQDASDWHHDFGDGRGSILSYGHWFMRLETPFSGIGIHGSTNNEDKMPGRDSEGCIRMRDNDLDHLHDNYAYVGMPVIIQAENDDPLPFETHARRGDGKQVQ